MGLFSNLLTPKPIPLPVAEDINDEMTLITGQATLNDQVIKANGARLYTINVGSEGPYQIELSLSEDTSRVFLLVVNSTDQEVKFNIVAGKEKA